MLTFQTGLWLSLVMFRLWVIANYGMLQFAGTERLVMTLDFLHKWP